jgi:hypothetical protein
VEAPTALAGAPTKLAEAPTERVGAMPTLAVAAPALVVATPALAVATPALAVGATVSVVKRTTASVARSVVVVERAARIVASPEHVDRATVLVEAAPACLEPATVRSRGQTPRSCGSTDEEERMPRGETKDAVKAANTKVMQGVDKNLTNLGKVTLGGKDYTPAEIKAVFQGDTDAVNATDAAHKNREQAVSDERAAHARTRQFKRLLRSFLIGHFGLNAVAVLGQFGFDAPKVKPRVPVKVKAEAKVKSEATREARHTMGRRQKKGIKGQPKPANGAQQKNA